MLSRALSLATVMLLIGCFAADPAQAQATNLEAGKSPSQIFAGTCTACHKSPRGLLRTVSPGSLPGFLRQHYTTSSEMAGPLSAYLISNGATDTRAGAQSRQGKDAQSEARPSGAPEQVDRFGRKLRPGAPAQEGTAKPEPQQAAKPDADGISAAPAKASPDGMARQEQATASGWRGRERGLKPPNRWPRVSEVPTAGKASSDWVSGANPTAKSRPKPTHRQRREPSTGEPAKDEKSKSEPKSDTAKDEGNKPDGAKPSGEAKSEPAKPEPSRLIRLPLRQEPDTAGARDRQDPMRRKRRARLRHRGPIRFLPSPRRRNPQRARRVRCKQQPPRRHQFRQHPARLLPRRPSRQRLRPPSRLRRRPRWLPQGRPRRRSPSSFSSAKVSSPA